MNKMMGTLKPGLMLLLVACVAALILGLVNGATEGPIAVNAEETMNRAMRAVLPADAYTDLEAESNEELNAVYAAEGGGWVVQVTESGSQGLITMMVGVSSDHACTGISVTKSSETAGLGAIAGQSSEKGEAFRAQFVGQTGTVAVTKDGGEIDAISGATITSKAVCRGVTAALAACQALDSSGSVLDAVDSVTSASQAGETESALPAAGGTEPGASEETAPSAGSVEPDPAPPVSQPIQG